MVHGKLIRTHVVPTPARAHLAMDRLPPVKKKVFVDTTEAIIRTKPKYDSGFDVPSSVTVEFPASDAKVDLKAGSCTARTHKEPSVGPTIIKLPPSFRSEDGTGSQTARHRPTLHQLLLQRVKDELTVLDNKTIQANKAMKLLRPAPPSAEPPEEKPQLKFKNKRAEFALGGCHHVWLPGYEDSDKKPRLVIPEFLKPRLKDKLWEKPKGLGQDTKSVKATEIMAHLNTPRPPVESPPKKCQNIGLKFKKGGRCCQCCHPLRHKHLQLAASSSSNVYKTDL